MRRFLCTSKRSFKRKPGAHGSLMGTRSFSGGNTNTHLGQRGGGVMNVFDRTVKRHQRDVAATREGATQYDYLRKEVARRLVDRVLDVKQKDFPVCVDLGCGTGTIGKFLGKNGKVQTFLQLELSEKALKRDLNQPFSGEEWGEAIPESRQTFNVVADEEFLPLKNHSVDLVISSLSLHWVNDLPGVLAQVRRALKPDGLFLAAMLGGETLQELRSSLAVADLERKGGVQPHLSPFAQIKDCAELLQQAGFSLPTVDTEQLTVPYPDMFTLIDHLQGMAEQNAPVVPPTTSPDTFLSAASVYQEMYGNEEGTVPATFQVVYMIGWAPHESQPKPARRGSARNKLSDIDDLLIEPKKPEA